MHSNHMQCHEWKINHLQTCDHSHRTLPLPPLPSSGLASVDHNSSRMERSLMKRWLVDTCPHAWIGGQSQIPITLSMVICIAGMPTYHPIQKFLNFIYLNIGFEYFLLCKPLN
jgi:hypothetical protein